MQINKNIKTIILLGAIVFAGELHGQVKENIAPNNIESNAETSNILPTKNETLTKKEFKIEQEKYHINKMILPSTENIKIKDTILNQTSNIIITNNIVSTFDRKLLYSYKPGKEISSLPKKPVSRYPDINIDGYYEGKISGRDYNPKLGDGISGDSSLWQTIQSDPVYNKLPSDVLLGDPKLEVRYKFQIDGKLDDDLTVHYDVEQEPEFPGKYDIKVQYKKNKLTFYHFDTTFEQGEYININRALNGAMYETETPSWETKIATGRLRSTPQKFSSFGNNRKEMNIGRTNILRGSVRVFKNNKRMSSGNYDINEFLGKVTFKTAPTPQDFIEIIYEFTNPIEDFIPILNRKNFLGAQYKWRSKTIVKEKKQTQSMSEKIKIPTSNIYIYNKMLPINIFYLKKAPVVLGTSEVILNNIPLQKNEDYFLKTHSGRLKIIGKRLNPSDNLIINYSYYEKKKVTEDIIATNSPGWYDLKSPHIIDGSSKVFINDIEVHEAIDYIIDYESGKLRFNYTVFYPQIISIEYEAIKTIKEERKNQTNPIDVSVTYLNEYVKTEEQDLNKQITSENATISNNIIILQNSPIVSTKDIKVHINNQKVDSNDYVLNAYKGEIRLLNIPPVKNAVISYKYIESFKTQTQFSINIDSNNNLFKNNEYQGFYLRDTPVQHNGIEQIQIIRPGKDIIRLNDKKSYEIDYGDSGQNISIRFIEKKSNNESILDSTLMPKKGDLIKIIYKYTPNKSSGPGNIDQKQYGVVLGAKISDRWRVDTEISAASNNVSKPEIFAEETINGTGVPNAAYKLGHGNLVEDSESVTMQLRNQHLTSGRDYILNYQNGELRFINLTPSQNDIILVNYKYYDNSNFELKNKKASYATKLSTSYNFDHVSLSGNFKKIDRDYTSLASLQGSAAGSTAFGGNLDWKINKSDTFNVDYQRQSTFTGKKDNNDDAFTNSDQLNTSTKIKFFNYFDTTQSTSFSKSIQDPLTTINEKNLHAVDSESFSYSINSSFGPSSFRQSISQSIGETNTDILDKVEPSKSNNKSFSYSSSIFLKNLFLLGNTSINPNYIRSSTKTKQTSFNEKNTKITSTLSTSEGKGISTEINPLYKLTGRFSYNTQETFNTGTSVSENRTQAQQESYQVNYVPYTYLNTAYSHSKSESESFLVGQSNPRSFNTSYNVNRFGYKGLLSRFLGLNRDGFLASIIGDTYSTFSNNINKSYSNNDLNKNQSNSERWSINSIAPLKGLRIDSINKNTSKSTNTNLVETSTSSQNINENISTSLSGSLTYKPPYPILKLFSYSLSLQESISERISQTIATTITNNTTIDETKNNTRSQSLAFNPGQIKIGIPNIFMIKLGTFNASIGESLYDKVDKDITRKTPTDPNKAPTESVTQNDQLKTNYTYTASLSPLNIITFSGGYTDTDDKTITHINGVNYRRSDAYNVSTQYKIFNFLTLSGSYSQAEGKQYSSKNPNLSFNDILTERDKKVRDLTLFKTGLESLNKTISGSGSLNLFSLLTINGGGGFSSQEQFSYTGESSVTKTKFRQYNANAGTSIAPLPGLSIGYNYQLNQTYQNSGNKQIGYQGTTTAKYTPIKTSFLDVNITYSRNDSWGKNFNQLEQSQLIEGTGRTVETKVIKTDHTVENFSLNVNVNMALNTSPYVDKLVITGEGYVKTINDRLEKEKGTQLSYEVGGMVIKGTLFF